MSNFEKANKYYHLGIWTLEMLKNAADKKFITQEEYIKIISEA